MAAFVFTDADLSINSVDLSDHGISVTVDLGLEPQDITAFGHTARATAPGLKTGDLQIEFLQDYASSEVDATIGPAALDGSTFTVVIKPTKGAVSSTNPSYTATMWVSSYQAIGGSVGDQAKASVTFANNGSDGWARAE